MKISSKVREWDAMKFYDDPAQESSLQHLLREGVIISALRNKWMDKELPR